MVGSIKMNKKKENHTGIPTQLKERIEQSSGVSLNDVRVNYNSYLPARLDALAYTQGTRVEIGPGQDRHLPHELGHVVQQKLGAVRANAMHPSGIPMNTDAGLEHQADEIGAGKKVAIAQRMGHNVVQRCPDGQPDDQNNGNNIPPTLRQGEQNTYVYVGMRNDQSDYVGITNDVARRQQEHGARFDYLIALNEQPLYRREARGIEQAMMEANPQFSNKRNSIDPQSDLYKVAPPYGEQWLKNRQMIP